MRYNRKIIFLAIFLLLAPAFVPYGFGFSKRSEKDNLVSHAELCCCGNDISTCSDCCCSTDSAAHRNDYYTEPYDLQRPDNRSKQLFIINACGGKSHDDFITPDLNYIVSLSSYDNYQPDTISNEAITLRHKGPRLTPPYKPPRS